MVRHEVEERLLLDLLATQNRAGVDAAMEPWIESMAATLGKRAST